MNSWTGRGTVTGSRAVAVRPNTDTGRTLPTVTPPRSSWNYRRNIETAVSA